MAQRQRRQAEAQNIGIAKVADDTLRNERLDDFIGMGMAERDMAAALLSVPKPDDASFRRYTNGSYTKGFAC